MLSRVLVPIGEELIGGLLSLMLGVVCTFLGTSFGTVLISGNLMGLGAGGKFFFLHSEPGQLHFVYMILLQAEEGQ